MTEKLFGFVFNDPGNLLGRNDPIINILRHNHRHTFALVFTRVKLTPKRSGLKIAPTLFENCS